MKPPIVPVRTAAAVAVLLFLALGVGAVWRASRALHSATCEHHYAGNLLTSLSQHRRA
jgi:hypothetical protein